MRQKKAKALKKQTKKDLREFDAANPGKLPKYYEIRGFGKNQIIEINHVHRAMRQITRDDRMRNIVGKAKRVRSRNIAA